MIDSFHILFFLYKSKINDKGQSPVFCRITLNNVRKQFSTGIFIKEINWNVNMQRVKGNSIDVRRINENLDLLKQKVQKSYDDIAKTNDIFYVNDIYNRFSGNDKEYKTLLQAFDYHNRKMKALVGKDYVKATYDKFVIIHAHIKDFIKHQYSKPDYPLHEIKLSFLVDLDYYLKVEKNQNQNTINKIIERVKKVIKISVGNGWLTSDPFILYQKKKFVKEVIFLNTVELALLENHKFKQERLADVRDCFIFSCFTGLAYNEAALLSDKHLQTGDDGFTWIEMTRQKTQRPITVPILPQAMKILKKYGYPKRGQLLPLISNQKMNSYLKEIGPIVGINKILTHHVARKTFASTVLMKNDISIEIVSFLLGHSKTTTTELHYAKVVKESVTRHMKNLTKRLK